MFNINLPKIQGKYKIVAVVGMVLLITGSYYNLAYRPHAKKISEINEELLVLDDTLKIIKTIDYPLLKNNISILNKIERNKKNILKKIKIKEEMLITKVEFSKMLEKITHIAYESGFDIKSLEPTNFAQKGNYQSMRLSMEITTRFNNLLSFLEKLKDLPVYPEHIEISTINRPNLMIKMSMSILAK